MLAPAVVGTFWKYFFEPQYGIFNRFVELFGGPGNLTMLGDTTLSPWAIVLVDTWMWTPYVMLLLLAGLRSIPPYLYEAAEIDRASEWTKFWRITLPMVLPFIILALLFRTIENFKMFDLVDQLTNGGPGSVTELASISLKREAFEKWRTGYASAFAIILFVSIYGLSLVAVRFLERVKQR
jgi:multiple sugar transport system permease protein